MGEPASIPHHLPLLVRDRARGAVPRFTSAAKADSTAAQSGGGSDTHCALPQRPARSGWRAFRDSFKGLSRSALRTAGTNPAWGTCLGSSMDERGTSNPEDAGSSPAQGARGCRFDAGPVRQPTQCLPADRPHRPSKGPRYGPLADNGPHKPQTQPWAEEGGIVPRFDSSGRHQKRGARGVASGKGRAVMANTDDDETCQFCESQRGVLTQDIPQRGEFTLCEVCWNTDTGWHVLSPGSKPGIDTVLSALAQCTNMILEAIEKGTTPAETRVSTDRG